MKRKSKKYLWRIGLLFLPLIVLGFRTPLFTRALQVIPGATLVPGVQDTRPPRIDYSAQLLQGVEYTRQVRSHPRPLVIHTVSIDLTAPDIGFLVTPAKPGVEIAARTTSTFLQEFGVQVAINGSYFEPTWAGMPWDYYPHSGDPVRVKGLAISGSTAYSQSLEGWPTLCIAGARVFIDRPGCPSETAQALAGNRLLVDNGLAVKYENDHLHPRTAVAATADGARLWLIVIDGRQRNYSEGVTLAELAEIIRELGADMAINLDGGGSSTLVRAGPGGPQILNAPIHTNIAMRQRPVANHLGIYAGALDFFPD